jgi:hypothetical protein
MPHARTPDLCLMLAHHQVARVEERLGALSHVSDAVLDRVQTLEREKLRQQVASEAAAQACKAAEVRALPPPLRPFAQPVSLSLSLSSHSCLSIISAMLRQLMVFSHTHTGTGRGSRGGGGSARRRATRQARRCSRHGRARRQGSR